MEEVKKRSIIHHRQNPSESAHVLALARATQPAYLILSDLITVILFGKDFEL
jgi:hypothetical protein